MFFFVFDNEVKTMKVTIYPAFTHQRNGRISVLCQANYMFPDLVTFSWKMEREDGRLMEVPEAEREELEQREDGRGTIINNEDLQKFESDPKKCRSSIAKNSSNYNYEPVLPFVV